MFSWRQFYTYIKPEKFKLNTVIQLPVKSSNTLVLEMNEFQLIQLMLPVRSYLFPLLNGILLLVRFPQTAMEIGNWAYISNEPKSHVSFHE